MGVSTVVSTRRGCCSFSGQSSDACNSSVSSPWGKGQGLQVTQYSSCQGLQVTISVGVKRTSDQISPQSNVPKAAKHGTSGNIGLETTNHAKGPSNPKVIANKVITVHSYQ